MALGPGFKTVLQLLGIDAPIPTSHWIHLATNGEQTRSLWEKLLTVGKLLWYRLSLNA